MSAGEGQKFRILSLDGGGAKGAYTLGALFEMEKRLGGGPLCEQFDLIFGTSTGAVIAAFLGLGYKAESIYDEYKEVIPRAFSETSPKKRSLVLHQEALRIFQNQKFDSFKTRVSIICTNVDQENAKIFKSNVSQSYTGKATFIPGFGATIVDVVVASAAAVPYFNSHTFSIPNDGLLHLIDGGFVANNPSLFALTDAVGALKFDQKDISLISIGVGKYKEVSPPSPLMARIGKYLIDHHMPTDIFAKTLSASADSTDKIVEFAFPHVSRFRLCEAYRGSDFVTHLLEADPYKLDKMYAFGRRTFCEREKEFDAAFATGIA